MRWLRQTNAAPAIPDSGRCCGRPESCLAGGPPGTPHRPRSPPPPTPSPGERSESSATWLRSEQLASPLDRLSGEADLIAKSTAGCRECKHHEWFQVGSVKMEEHRNKGTENATTRATSFATPAIAAVIRGWLLG